MVPLGEPNSYCQAIPSQCGEIAGPVGVCLVPDISDYLSAACEVNAMPVLAVLRAKGGPTCYEQSCHNVMALECILCYLKLPLPK